MKNLSPHSKGGFTLFELLAVMAVVAILSVTAVPAFSSLGASQGVKQGIYDIAGLLEFARNEAVTRQAYVWVGFENTVVNNQSVLCMAAVAAKDGSASTSNLIPLSRTIRLKNAFMVSWGSLKADTRACFPHGTPVSVAANTASIATSAPGGQVLSRSITFTPRGEALLTGNPDSASPYDAYIDLSFRQAKGTQVLPAADDAALVVEGSTGSVQLVRVK